MTVHEISSILSFVCVEDVAEHNLLGLFTTAVRENLDIISLRPTLLLRGWWMKINETFGFHRFVSVSVLRVYQGRGLCLETWSHTSILYIFALVPSSLFVALPFACSWSLPPLSVHTFQYGLHRAGTVSQNGKFGFCLIKPVQSPWLTWCYSVETGTNSQMQLPCQHFNPVLENSHSYRQNILTKDKFTERNLCFSHACVDGAFHIMMTFWSLSVLHGIVPSESAIHGSVIGKLQE